MFQVKKNSTKITTLSFQKRNFEKKIKKKSAQTCRVFVVDFGYAFQKIKLEPY